MGNRNEQLLPKNKNHVTVLLVGAIIQNCTDDSVLMVDTEGKLHDLQNKIVKERIFFFFLFLLVLSTPETPTLANNIIYI